LFDPISLSVLTQFPAEASLLLDDEIKNEEGLHGFSSMRGRERLERL
jgi:hypothetical protein